MSEPLIPIPVETWNTRTATTNAETARILQHLIKTEGLDAAYVWLGEIAADDEPVGMTRPGDTLHDT